jgi:hypothetical protein
VQARKLLVTRNIPADYAHNFLNRDVGGGEMFFEYRGHVPGLDTINRIALTEHPDTLPYFEFPRDAVTEHSDSLQAELIASRDTKPRRRRAAATPLEVILNDGSDPDEPEVPA